MTENVWLIELALRGGLILVLAGLAAAVTRNAVWRHLIWASALSGLIFLPVLMGGLPAIGLPILPPATDAPVQQPAPSPAIAPSAAPPTAVESPGAAARSGPAFERAALGAATVPSPDRSGALPSISLRVVWALVALLVGLAMAADRFRRHRLLRRALPLDSLTWRRDLERLEAGVELYTSADVDVPVTWGLVRPVLLLPVGAEEWSPSLRRHVLLHELAHVERCDTAVLGLARFACALHWFNPLAWWALRRLVREAELAADDRVLGAGVKPSSYAGDLVDFARRIRRPLPRAAAAMARRRSSLEDRVSAILDDARERSAPPPFRMALALIFFGLVVLPVAASLRPEHRVGPVAMTFSIGEIGVQVRPAPQASPVALAAAAQPSPEPSVRVASASPSPSSSPAGDTRRSLTSDCGESKGASIHSDDDRLTMTVRSARCELRIEAEGEIEYAADDSGIVGLGAGARLEIDERRNGSRRELTVRPGAGGAPEYRYFVDRDERPFDAEGRAWLAQVLPEIFRATGLNAEERVGRLLAAGGVERVLEEIALIRSDYVGRIYLNQLIQQGELDSAQLRSWIRLAGEQIGSDYELAETLVNLPPARLGEPGIGGAFVEAATTIGSDYELRRTLARLLDHSTPTRETLDRILAAAGTIGSDYEAAELLIRVAEVYPAGVALPATYYRVADSIGSDYELRRTLSKALERPLTGDTLVDLLDAARSIGSDYELAELLVAVSRSQRLDDAARAAFEAALETVGSRHEHRRAADALARHGS